MQHTRSLVAAEQNQHIHAVQLHYVTWLIKVEDLLVIDNLYLW